MYFKIPLNADLTNTSYRCYKETEDAVYIEYNEGYIGEDWEKSDEAVAREIAPEWFNNSTPDPEPTEDVTWDSMAAAIAEGVNDV